MMTNAYCYMLLFAALQKDYAAVFYTILLEQAGILIFIYFSIPLIFPFHLFLLFIYGRWKDIFEMP